VSFAEESLGGRTFWEYGDDGLVYYGAHLEKYGYSGHVEAGVVVGTVGITGDATAYHLHFQIGSNGGGWYNPYATLLQYC
jgi:murein DD-endopeptidase MepM/ murein hydrolase activator NlpD